MSLFGDLPSAKGGEDTKTESAGWAAPKLQAPTSLKRTPVGLAPPPNVLMRATGRGGVRTGAAGGRGAGGRGPSSAAAAAAGQGDTASPHGPAAAVPSTSIFSANGREIKDEYDPARPNDYEEVLKERERKRREAQAEAERQAKEAERLAKIREMEETMARLKEKEAEQMEEDKIPEGLALPVAAPGQAKGMTLAQKLLEKMGWKEGEGLGRNRQGMSTPLMAQKTAMRAGIIVNAEPRAPRPDHTFSAGPGPSSEQPGGEGEPAEKRQRTGASLVGRPSKVICLRNMVGPGEVDEELEDEVGNELLKYGQVTSVMIFEVTSQGWPEEEAVRIFVQFDRVEPATKAAIDLQGRFFAGRQVRVAFFDEERFEATDLAPKAGEFD